MLTGTAGVDEFLAHAATLDGFDTDAVTLPGAEVFQAHFEMRIGGRTTSLPPGLHPTNPPTLVVQVWRCPDSPWGSFALAQARVGARSGLRPRGFVHGCVADNPAAADALRRRWGLPVRLGDVRLERRYDGTSVACAIGSRTVAALTALGPEPLGPDDVAYSASVALARTPNGLRLVQIDAAIAVARAERVRPRLDHFDGPAWVHPSVEPYHPVSASVVIGDVTLPRLRFVCKPDELAFTGTESVGPPGS